MSGILFSLIHAKSKNSGPRFVRLTTGGAVGRSAAPGSLGGDARRSLEAWGGVFDVCRSFPDHLPALESHDKDEIRC